MKSNLKPHRCDRCGVLLSRDYPHNLCEECWRAKYHAPPGYNYFAEGGTAVNLAETKFCLPNPQLSSSLQRASSLTLPE